MADCEIFKFKSKFTNNTNNVANSDVGIALRFQYICKFYMNY